MRVYLVLYNGKVSQEGYSSYEDAVGFVKSRGFNIHKTGYGTYGDIYGNSYLITDVVVRNKK